MLPAWLARDASAIGIVTQSGPRQYGAGAPGGGALDEGESFTVTGTGFGSKASTTKIYDDCSGSDPGTLWDLHPPTTGGGPLDYRTPAGAGRGVSLPHSNITQYLCGSHNLNTGSGGQVVYVAKNFTKPAFPYYSYWSWFSRLDPNWVHDAVTPNHKFYGFSTGHGTIYNLPDNWYLEFKGDGDFTSSSASAQWHCVDDDVGQEGTDMHGAFGDLQPNPCGAWVKREILIKWQSNSTGFALGWANNELMWNETGVYTDGYAGEGNDRCEGIEGYAGNYNANNWRFFCDVMYMRGAHIGRFVVANHATYASATKTVVQDYNAAEYTDTSVELIAHKGDLDSGTNHLHYRDEVNGNQYLGTIEFS